jgi:hypothetical protein
MKVGKNPKEISEENKREMSDVLKNVQKDVQKQLTERQMDILELKGDKGQVPVTTFNRIDNSKLEPESDGQGWLF